ncbi:MAG TPA: GNAT family N-acetyltransferase [Chloroflexia bacterium]|nr:GNAT family N-acetyltransferase [Chloroflexia bacterium]
MEGYTWRAVQETDLDALAALDSACLADDGPVSVPPPAYGGLTTAPAVSTLCATPAGADAPIVAVGWVQNRGGEAELGGKVHPAHRRRGLGTHLLRWGAEQACVQGKPETLLIRNETLTSGSAALYQQEGYTCAFAELWMERDLHAPLPVGVPRFSHVSWTAENAPEFFAVYTDAFKERVGFPGHPAAHWIAEYVEDPDFRPDLSLLALVDGGPAGFVTAGVLPIPQTERQVGWVSQMGVRPAYRGRGIAADLLTTVMAGFQSEGYPALGLHVNVNNPRPIAVYKALGFRQVGQRVKYVKPHVCS